MTQNKTKKQSYFLTKAKAYTLKELFMLEFESYLIWPFRNIPSFLGFTIRYLIYKLLLKNISSYCVVQPNVYITHCFRITVGQNFVINSNSYINGVGEISIGDYVLIGTNVTISSGEHQYKDFSIPVTKQPIVPKKIVIEDDVWIGSNAVILPGLTIAKGTVVGAGAVVTKSTKPYTVVAGVPAVEIKKR